MVISTSSSKIKEWISKLTEIKERIENDDVFIIYSYQKEEINSLLEILESALKEV